VIGSPYSEVRRVSGQVTNYPDIQMALHRTATSLLEAKKSFRKLRGNAQMKSLINALRPKIIPIKKAP
jgi:hypothetical protein